MPRTFLAVLSLALLSGCASQQELKETNAQVDSLRMQVGHLEARVYALTKRPAVPAPREYYCYLNGQQYSKGAIVSGRICENKYGIETGEPQQLEWGLHDK